VIVTPHKEPRCTGTYAQMDALLNAAVREWNSLPMGREIETMAARV
jgi:hypothetical protein